MGAGDGRSEGAHPRPESSGDPSNALARAEGLRHARGPASDAPAGLSDAIRPAAPFR